ncbi:MAG: glycosyltransferase family 2 protein [Actinobacteria bacterium]|nr:glycosyltransferase family 2 protein [Actinomycetota bacterium]
MTISVVIVAYRSGPALLRCLESVGRDDGLEAIVVDNGAEAGEVERARTLPFVRVVSPGENLGFAGGCNAGAKDARGDVLVFLNPDTVVADGALRALARAAADPTVGVATARLRLLDRPDRLNSAGNVVHGAGFGWSGSYGEPVESASELRDVPYPSGAAMAIRADLFRELGGFAERLFLYQEDLELGWRARLRGLRIVMCPGADVLHDYDFDRHAHKRYFLERNRLVFVLTAYSPRLLAVLSPILVAAEVGLLALALKEGWAREKASGWAWCVRNRKWLGARRRETQALRRVRDRDLARLLTPVIDAPMIALPRPIRLVNRFVAGYWALAQRAL